MNCAHEKTRTSTRFISLAPQASASTNSATCAFDFEEKKLRLGLTFSDLAGARTQDPLLKREMLYQLSYQVFVMCIIAAAKIKCLINNTIFFFQYFFVFLSYYLGAFK